MTWIDGSRWDADRGDEITKILISEYPLDKDTVGLLTVLDLDKGLMPDAPNAKVRWIELTRAMHEARALRAVVDHLAGEKPKLAATLAELAADPPEAMDGNSADVYEVQLLFGRRPLIDRGEIRASLKRFLTAGFPLFVIRGQPRTGKTYCLELLQHVTSGTPNLVVVDIDFAPVANGDNAAALITKICRLVDIPEVSEINDPTTRTRKAIALVDTFIGRYKNKYTDSKNRLLVIDGLNRTDLQDDVYEAVAHLAVEIIRGHVSRTQLVLTGYPGTLDPDLDYAFLTEDVGPITEAHVRFFFEHLVLPESLSREKVDELVGKASVGQGDVKALGSRVRALTLELLGAP